MFDLAPIWDLFRQGELQWIISGVNMYITGRLHCQHTSLSNPIWAFPENRILTWAATTDSPWILAMDLYLQTLYYAGENSTKLWFINPCKPETSLSLKKQVLSILKFRSKDLFISPSIKWITVSYVCWWSLRNGAPSSVIILAMWLVRLGDSQSM